MKKANCFNFPLALMAFGIRCFNETPNKGN